MSLKFEKLFLVIGRAGLRCDIFNMCLCSKQDDALYCLQEKGRVTWDAISEAVTTYLVEGGQVFYIKPPRLLDEECSEWISVNLGFRSKQKEAAQVEYFEDNYPMVDFDGPMTPIRALLISMFIKVEEVETPISIGQWHYVRKNSKALDE